MILVDANILLYAKVREYPQHERARSWLEERLNAPARVGMPWAALLAFLRIVTNPRVFPSPLPLADAFEQVSVWLERANVWVPTPTDRHAEILKGLLHDAGATADLVPDAHLAALAVEHGLVVCSSDSDFRRFTAVRWEDPLRG